MKLRNLLAATAAISAFTASAAFAAEPEACKQPHFADVGWTDNTAHGPPGSGGLLVFVPWIVVLLECC